MRDFSENRIRGVRGDTGALDRGRVAPYGVVVPVPQHHRPIRHGGVEPARIEQTIRGKAAVIGRPDDPFRAGIVSRELFYREDDFVDGGTVADGGTDGFQTTIEGVGVPVAEGRHQKPAIEVNVFGGAVLRCQRTRLVAYCAHRAVDDQQCIGVCATGPDHPAGEQCRRCLLGTHRAMVAIGGLPQ